MVIPSANFEWPAPRLGLPVGILFEANYCHMFDHKSHHVTQCRFWWNDPNRNKFHFALQLKRDDRKKIEMDIRDALESICKPDEVEQELRSAMATLQLDSSASSKEDD